ncbi:unnamed protein product [Phytophthora lilii]|uniref:Unnamed protein product n=1 Tax=Phytophthora lilii TaxID=2077276 RepID=A0A9W7CTL3_9STRA|nr:unnamed protein product [Phytophthora lilii]
MTITMCNYIMKNGRQCPKSKTLDRCYVHPISKYREPEMNVDTAEEMIMTIFDSDNHEEILCPCGKATKRWNYAHHCSFPKHKTWVKMMPEPKTIRSWIATGNELGGFN